MGGARCGAPARAADSGAHFSCSFNFRRLFRGVHAEAFRPLTADGPCRSAARPTLPGR